MENTRNFEFKKLNTESLSNHDEQYNDQEFQQYTFPKLENINSEQGMYFLHGANTTERIQADTAYEAVSKTNLKDIKMICKDNISRIKDVFTLEGSLRDKA